MVEADVAAEDGGPRDEALEYVGHRALGGEELVGVGHGAHDDVDGVQEARREDDGVRRGRGRTSVGRSMLPSSIVRPMTPTPEVVLTSTVVQAEASAPRHMMLRMSGIVPTYFPNARDGQ